MLTDNRLFTGSYPERAVASVSVARGSTSDGGSGGEVKRLSVVVLIVLFFGGGGETDVINPLASARTPCRRSAALVLQVTGDRHGPST